jgi:hypothetical protein
MVVTVPEDDDDERWWGACPRTGTNAGAVRIFTFIILMV